jgi:iron complex outermembrane receptor protein
VALRYALSEDANIYASVSQGFMSGNYTYTTVGPQEAVDPEEVTQYEVGYKISRPGWSFETAAFLSDYRDLQVVVFDSSCGCFHVDNAPRAETYGAEAHLLSRVTDNLTINTGVAYTHARYEEYLGAGAPGTPYIPPNYGYATVAEDFSGNQMIRAPEWTANFGVSHISPLAGGELALSANVYYTSDIPLTPDNRIEQESYTLLGLRAGWTAPSEVWTLSAFGNNVTDEEFKVFSWAGFLGNNIVYGPPAVWGARLDLRF